MGLYLLKMVKALKIKMNEKGQTLLFVVVAATIALSVGVAVSTRTLGNLRNVSRTDSASRVMGVAEGGIESLLVRNYSELDAAMNPSEGNCVSVGATYDDTVKSCVYDFTGSSDDEDLVSSRAVITVGTFTANEISDGYAFSLNTDSVREVNLSGYNADTVEICWVEDKSAIYYYSYNPDGDLEKGGIYPTGGLVDVDESISGLFDVSASERGMYKFCKYVNLASDPYGLRIKALYNNATVAVFPEDGYDLPSQGYVLISKGEIVTGSGGQEVATVIVHKTYPYSSPIFDYGIYTPNSLDAGTED